MLRLTAERTRRGWSQAELARQGRLHPSTISLVESGRLRPGPEQLDKVARAFGWPARDAARLLEEVEPAGARR